MKLLDQCISQTGKQSADRASHAIQKYPDYVQSQVTEVSVTKRHDSVSDSSDNGRESSCFRRLACREAGYIGDGNPKTQ